MPEDCGERNRKAYSDTRGVGEGVPPSIVAALCATTSGHSHLAPHAPSLQTQPQLG